jgi:RNA polymerase sigma-70 factor (ECF subfamily)
MEADGLPCREMVGASFDQVVMPHLDAAHRLARWLLRNEHDAEDVVQEASLRAFRYLHTFHGGNARAWFLRIVRNTCWAWPGAHFHASTDPFDEEQHSGGESGSNPETLLLRSDSATLIERAMNALPLRLRRLLALRELEGLSYRELADRMDMPMGTVMSSLSRARQAFRGALESQITHDRVSRRENIELVATANGASSSQPWREPSRRESTTVAVKSVRSSG